MEELGLHGPGIAWRRHLQRKAPESLGRPVRRAANDMNDLYLSKIYQLLRPVCGGVAHHYPKSGANGMAMSRDMMVDFEPPLAVGAVSNPRSSLAAMRAKRDRRIAIMAP
jgi:flavin reductase (DIM6/NTAB) family NADH-FMN oxidoreductase RutF